MNNSFVHVFIRALNKYLLDAFYVLVFIKYAARPRPSCHNHFTPHNVSPNTESAGFAAGLRKSLRSRQQRARSRPLCSLQSAEGLRLPRALPGAPPLAASRDAVAEPKLLGLSRAKFVAGGRCRCNHKG